MKKLRILVDMDEVLNNLLEAWVAYLNERYSVNARVQDVNAWCLTCVYPFLTVDEVNRPLYEDAFFRTLKP
jgi:5'(3')-deoxyribonucleotidase